MSLPPPPPPPPQHLQDQSLDPSASSHAGGKKKRGGAPKAKGAVRAKSGCYTCRIRRKKCDERPDREGNCETCVRLRLECLGFGAKRPDWMRENNSVQELREKIKQFLASQGMIKGHSGGGVRPADQDPSVLNLSTDPGTLVPGSSAPMPTNDHHHRSGPRMPPVSSVRDGPHEHMVHFPPPPLPGGHPFPPPPGQGHHTSMGPPQHHPPLVGAMPVHLDPELAYMPPSYGQPPPQQQQQQQQSSRPPMSSIPASPWPSAPSLLPPSSFGASYNIHDDYYNNQVQDVSPSSEIMHAIPTEISQSFFPFVNNTREASHLSHYMRHVLRIQYLLADPSIENFIFRFAQTSPTASSAMCLLSAVHQQRMRSIEFPRGSGLCDTAEMDHLFRQTRSMLRGRDTYTEGDAMAGLHVVSCFLFTGGHGPWNYFLHVAICWVESVLLDTRYHGPLDAYTHCTESKQFIIRTTMWFDVWSAVTKRTQPRFRKIYRELFDGEHGYSTAQAGKVDMLPVMGCTNETVLAMSETASLAYWKDEHMKQRNLSMPSLIERGRNIEVEYLSRDRDATLDSVLTTTDLEARRRLAADVFRSSARVYLHSVLSGCKPNVQEISFGVTETVNFLKRVPNSEGASRNVVRSVVLSIALCGCMTDDESHRKFLASCLMSLAGQEVEVLGNCTQAKRLMELVWDKRDRGVDLEVDWRDVIRDMSNADLLLV